jgi:hypothetical protein
MGYDACIIHGSSAQKSMYSQVAGLMLDFLLIHQSNQHFCQSQFAL